MLNAKKKLFMLALKAHEKNPKVPKPVWCVSQTFYTQAEENNDDFTLEHASKDVVYPRRNTLNIDIVTHRFGALHYAASYFSLVVLDEICIVSPMCHLSSLAEAIVNCVMF